MVELQSSKLSAWVRFLLFLQPMLLNHLQIRNKLTNYKSTVAEPVNTPSPVIQLRSKVKHRRKGKGRPTRFRANKGFKVKTFFNRLRNQHLVLVGTARDYTDCSWGSFTKNTLTHKVSTQFPTFWRSFLYPNQQLNTSFFVQTNQLISLFVHAYKSNLVDFTFSYKHTTINSSWQSGKFYNYYSGVTGTRSYLRTQKNFLTLTSKCDKLTKPGQPTNFTTNPLKLLKLNFFNVLININLTHSTKKTSHDQRHQGWVRKLLSYLHLRRNIRRFKPRVNYYDTHRYQYRSYRSFTGARWSYVNPGYHQSFYESIRHNKSILINPTLKYGSSASSKGVFFLQLFMFSDLVAESRFIARLSFVMSDTFLTSMNWRSKESLQGYLFRLIPKSFIEASYIKNKRVFKNNRRRRQQSKKGFTGYEQSVFNQSSGVAGYGSLRQAYDNLDTFVMLYEPTPLLGVMFKEHQPINVQLTPIKSLTKSPQLLQINPFFAKELFTNITLLKYTLTKQSLQNGAFSKQGSLTTDYLFKDKLSSNVRDLNVNPAPSFSYEIQRRLVKSFAVSKLTPKVTPWYLTNLVRFIEHCSGRKVSVKLNPFLANSLTFTDRAKCTMWLGRILSFQRLLGPKFFLDEILVAMTIALKSKDATFLSNWIRGMLKRMSFWKMRVFFRFLKYMMRYVFYTSFDYLHFKGMKICLKGKISVAGNARTRTLLYRIGTTSYSTFDNKVSHDFSCIGSFTGVMGFRIWLFF